jgi:hypothetical protein
MSDMQEFSQVIGLLVVLYLAGLLIIARRLRTAHGAEWIDLGSPSLLNWSISNSFRLGAFVFFRSKYRRLGDPMLGWLVWIERAVALLVIALIVFWKLHFG